VSTADTTTTDRRSPLERRRAAASAAAGAAEKARARVAELDRRLQTNATMTTEQSQALRNATAEVARLKRALKGVARERDGLAKDRRKAAGRADKAGAKAKRADDKYSKSMLAEMIRREKDKDLARVSPDPPPEQPNAAMRDATRTAARKTAEAAGADRPRTASPR